MNRRMIDLYGRAGRSMLGIMLAVLMLCAATGVHAQVRIKDIARVQGMEARSVTGFGLVMGLAGTGDGVTVIFTIQSVANLLKNMGLTVDQNRLIMRNVAAVMVEAKLPPFTRQGGRADVTVSSMGDASSLEGGTLIQTSLFDASGEILAIAQGPITVGGRNVDGAGGTARQNYVLTGRIEEGARALKDLPLNFVDNSAIQLTLNRPDFTSAVRLANRVNRTFQENIALPLDGGTVRVDIPQTYINNNNMIQFISDVELLEISPDAIARVVVNERTGTVVVGGEVRISPVAISHGDLSIQIQPQAPAAGAAPAAAQQNRVVVLGENEGSNVRNLADALNALSVTPKDIIAIFQALKQAGALQADLLVI